MDIINNKNSCYLIFNSIYKPLLRGKNLQEIAKITKIPLHLLQELSNRGKIQEIKSSNKSKQMARVLSFCLKGKRYFTSDADIAKDTTKTLQFTEDDLNWNVLDDEDWIRFAESIVIVSGDDSGLSDSEFDEIAEEILDENFINSALKDWKTKAPEQFKNILESE